MPFAGRRRPAQILRLASTVARQIIVALTNRKIERRDFVLVLKLNATRIDTLVVEACPPNIKQLAVEFWMSGYVRSPWSCDSEAPVPRAARAASPVSPRLSRPSHERAVARAGARAGGIEAPRRGESGFRVRRANPSARISFRITTRSATRVSVSDRSFCAPAKSAVGDLAATRRGSRQLNGSCST